MRRKNGFTLVELSIVMVIIALLLAGITSGRGLVKQAELNSILTEMQMYQAAYNTFVLRRASVPGDIKNAESRWSATGSTPCAVTAGNCNGNGNSLINFGALGASKEIYAAWKQLSLEDIITSGTVAVPDNLVNSTGTVVIGENVPESKYEGAGYIMTGDNISMDVASPWKDIANAVFIANIGATGTVLDGGILSPEDAYNLDQKIDDATFLGSAETPLDALINSALARSAPSGGHTGASTGGFRSITGSGASGSCVSGGMYDFSNERLECISGMALN